MPVKSNIFREANVQRTWKYPEPRTILQKHIMYLYLFTQSNIILERKEKSTLGHQDMNQQLSTLTSSSAQIWRFLRDMRKLFVSKT